MSTMLIGHRRVQIRAVIFVAVVFLLILVFTASSTKIQDHITSFRSGNAPASNSPHSSGSEPNHPTFDYNYDNIDKVSATKERAHDPCADMPMSEGGTAPQKVDGTWVLVTGGAGFIGSNLVDRLLNLGYKVRVFDNLYTGFIRNVPLDDPRIEFFLGDIMDPGQLEKAVKGVDFVFHLAAMSKVVPSLKSPDMARFCVESNALGTWNVLNAVREKGGIKKVIYAASSTYYGNMPPPHKEDMAPDFLTPYAASKYEGELQMQMFDRLFSVPTISTRFFMVYGPRQPSTGAYAIVTGVFAKQAADGKQLTIEGDGSHYRDFIHVSDIVNGLILSQQREELHSNVVNLGTGTAFTVQDVADLVSKDQKHVDARKNDLEGTLADTCRMKHLLNYQAKADFKTEMSYMVKETLNGNVFMQKWLKPLHALSAPHIMAPGSPVFGWPKAQDDLDALLASLKNIDTGVKSEERSITVIPFGVGNGDAAAAWLLGDILLNTIFSLVRFGGVSSYIVAATDKSALDMCVDLNVPCYDAQGLSAPALLNTLLSRGYSVHYAQLGNSYIRPVAEAFGALTREHSDANVLQASPFGDVFVRFNDNARSALASWANDAQSVKPSDLFNAAVWPSTVAVNKATYVVQTLCKGSLSGGRMTVPVTSPPMEPEAADAQRLAANPTKAYVAEAQATGSAKRSQPSSAPSGMCEGSRFYVSVGCSGEDASLIAKNPKSVKEELQKNGLWHLSECVDKLHCDHQQSVPLLWVQSSPDLETRGGMC